LLLQGTVDRRLTAEVPDWHKFGDLFAGALAGILNLENHSFSQLPWFDSAAMAAVFDRFVSNEWNQRR
jgi:hypothetical protein